jgi:glycosyltransferase involved in cell wall biosynthesis
MNILLLTHIFPPAIDGGSRVIYKLGKYLAKDTKVFCITSNCFSTDDFVNPDSKSITQKIDLNIETYRLPVYKLLRKPLKFINLFIPKNTYLHGFLEVFQKGPIFKVFPLIKTLNYFKNHKPDLIIAGPLPTTISIYAKFLSRIYHCKLLINPCFHETDPDFFKKPLIDSIKTADYLWTLTQHETDYFQSNFNIDSQKIILAGNGVDNESIIETNQIKFPKNQRLLFIGSFAFHKKIDVLLEAFSCILKKHPDLKLILAGQKTLYFPKIEKLIEKLCLSEHIDFKFNFSQSELSELIDNSTMLVLPSIQESFGLVLIEAWSRGKPVITSDIPTLKELISNTDGGLTFKKDDPNDLCLKIENLLNDSEKCNELGQNGFKYVKNNYTWSKVSQKIWQKISS